VKRVLTAVILIPIVILALFKAPLWLFTLLVLGVALLAAREYFDIAEATGYRPMRAWSYLFLACIFIIAYYPGNEEWHSGPGWYEPPAWHEPGILAIAALLLLLASPFILLAGGMRRDPLSQALPDSASSFLLLPYVGLSLGAIVRVRSHLNGALFLLFLMLLVWCGDIAAYYIGRAIGRHKLAPRISPGKTWEGAIASVVGAVIVGVLLFHYINPIANALRAVHLLTPPVWDNRPGVAASFAIAPVWLVAALAVSVNVAAQVGDLVESALKRGAGLKDSGTLLPGHGGVLDRIDALLFALPVGLLFYIAMSRYFELRGLVT
jgi:phosphatidate cytidylyltransferase